MKVVNIRKEQCDVYVGRKRYGMHYGNPFSHKQDTLASTVVASIEEAIFAFEVWLDGTAYSDIEPERRAWILANLHKLTDKDLGCFCAPNLCHASVLLKKANNL